MTAAFFFGDWRLFFLATGVFFLGGAEEAAFFDLVFLAGEEVCVTGSDAVFDCVKKSTPIVAAQITNSTPTAGTDQNAAFCSPLNG